MSLLTYWWVDTDWVQRATGPEEGRLVTGEAPTRRRRRRRKGGGASASFHSYNRTARGEAGGGSRRREGGELTSPHSLALALA